jgi:hypothetical protein
VPRSLTFAEIARRTGADESTPNLHSGEPTARWTSPGPVTQR